MTVCQPTPQVSGDRCDAVAVTAHPAARLDTGAFGQHRARRDDRGRLGPRPGGTRRLWAAPPPLAPAQLHPPGERVDVAHHDRGAALAQRPHPTPSAPRPVRRGLDRQLDLAVNQAPLEQLEAVQSEQHSVGSTTLNTHLKPFARSLDNHESRRASGVQTGTTTGTLAMPAPHFMT